MTITDANQVRGQTAVGPSGEKIGTIEAVYFDNETDKPEWLAVKTGLFGMRESFVPLANASVQGDSVAVAYGKDKVKDAPNIDADGELSQDEEARLYQHYGLPYSDAASKSGLPEGGGAPSGTDKAMTRSEEELRVGKTTQEAGKARLRKWVETEQVSATVPVTHEEVRVEREPITGANRDQAMKGAEITESEYEVTLHEEQAVAAKETVPKERIRLEKDVVTEEATVGADLRKERIETEVKAPKGR